MNYIRYLWIIGFIFALTIQPSLRSSFAQTPLQTGPTISNNLENLFLNSKSPGLSAISAMKAPNFTLPSSLGGKISLDDFAGKKNVLLYFQEGIMCSPCWQELEDIQKNYDKFKSLDIEVLTISVDPLNADVKESNKRGINLPVLDDGNLSVSKAYNVLDFSMHPGSRPGHTFVLIGKDGNIIWRKDYYQSVEQGGMMMNGMNMNMAGRMYVPIDELLREIYKVSYLLFPEPSSTSSSQSTSPLSAKTNGSNFSAQRQRVDQAILPSVLNNKTAMVDHSMCLTPIHRHADLKIYLNDALLNLSQRKYMDQDAVVHFHPTVKVKPNDIPGIPFGDMVHIHEDNVTIRNLVDTLDLDNQSLKALQSGSIRIYVDRNVTQQGLSYVIHDMDRILVTNTPAEKGDDIAKQMESVSSFATIGKEKNPSLFGGC